MDSLGRRKKDSYIPRDEATRVVLNEEDLTEADFKELELLEPSLNFKFLTNPWLSALGLQRDVSNQTKRRGWMRENRYMDVPDKFWDSPKTDSKHFVYELLPRGEKVNKSRGVPFLKRAHRSNSYYHECITDMCFAAPLRLLAKEPDVRLLTPADLLKHDNVPQATRDSEKPFALYSKLRKKDIFLDYPPQVLIFKDKTICIPGIQTDRGTEGNELTDYSKQSLGHHIEEFFDLLKHGQFDARFGFDSFVLPMLICDARYDKEAKTNGRLNRVMKWFEGKYGKSEHIIWKQVPDIARLKNFPKPSTDWITTPWKRVGFDDFSFI